MDAYSGNGNRCLLRVALHGTCSNDCEHSECIKVCLLTIIEYAQVRPSYPH